MARVTSNYWDFIMAYLPYYSSDNRVLKSDILYRFLDNDEIAEEDIANIKGEYNLDKYENSVQMRERERAINNWLMEMGW